MTGFHVKSAPPTSPPGIGAAEMFYSTSFLAGLQLFTTLEYEHIHPPQTVAPLLLRPL